MKRLLYILLFLPFMAQAQTGVKWDRFFYTGSMKVGGGLGGYANATLAAQDSASYAESCAWIEAGGDTSKRGILAGRVLRRDSVSSPKKGLIIYEHVSGLFLGYDGSAWDTLSVVGSGSGGSSTPDSTTAGYGTTLTGKAIGVDTSLIRTVANSYNKAQVDAKDALKLDIADTLNKWVPIGTPDNNTTYTAGWGSDLTGTVFSADSIDLSLYYIRRKDSSQYVTRTRLDDSCDAIRADMGAGGGVTDVNGDAGPSVLIDLQSVCDEDFQTTTPIIADYFEADQYNVKTASGVSINTSLASTTRRDTIPDLPGIYIIDRGAQTLYDKTIITPTIASFTNAQHNHSNAAGGGQITLSTGVIGTLPIANLDGRTERTYSASVTGTSTGNTTVFTTEASRGRFIITRINYWVTATASASVNGQYNLGWTGANYLDIQLGATLDRSLAVNTQFTPVTNSIVTIPAATAVVIKILTAVTASTYNFQINVTGFYENP